jgi:DNA-binding NarL/FixJ family response regulator
LVDDHSLVRYGIKALLAIVDTVEVIGEAKNGHEALYLVEQFQPDLLLVDIGLKDMNGLELSRRLKQHSPFLKILILSMYDNSST